MTILPLSICPQCRALRHSLVVVSLHGSVARHEHFCEACHCFLRAEEIALESGPDPAVNSGPAFFHGKIMARCEP